MNTARLGGYHFRPLPELASAPAAWRALDRAVARWVVLHGGSPLLAQLAGWASLAEGNGDSALLLRGPDADRHGMPALDGPQRTALHAEPMVSVASEDPGIVNTPFIVDHDYFYLRRNFIYEVAVARHIQARRAASRTAGTVSMAAIDVLFHGQADDCVQPQRQAVAAVLGRRLFVLTGSPGTGKTSTVLRMLLMLVKDHVDRAEAAPVIRISAPTGKAAQRLSESLHDGAKRLREHVQRPLPPSWQPYLQAVLAAEASTLHRLLGSRGHHGGFSHHADNPLPADIVVVDEASMVDLAMLRVLLEALKSDATLILVGDADQLTSVGSGSVLLDLVSVLESQAAPELVRLHHSFRADMALVSINAAILGGNNKAFEMAWQAAGPKAIRRKLTSSRDLSRTLGAWCRQLHRLLEQSGACDVVPTQGEERVLKALDGLRRRQLLCALREGEWGAEQVNAVIGQTLSSQLDGYTGASWYPGRAVIITRNDYSLGLFNGDVGLCLRDEPGQLGVWFEVTAPRATTATASVQDSASQRRVKCLAPGSLPEHRGAFALTIHKSQGSEYDHVALLLPPDADNRILSRQLLYTGVSRARQVVEIWGSDAALRMAIATPVKRAGGLQQRFMAGY